MLVFDLLNPTKNQAEKWWVKNGAKDLVDSMDASRWDSTFTYHLSAKSNPERDHRSSSLAEIGSGLEPPTWPKTFVMQILAHSDAILQTTKNTKYTKGENRNSMTIDLIASVVLTEACIL